MVPHEQVTIKNVNESNFTKFKTCRIRVMTKCFVKFGAIFIPPYPFRFIR